MTYLLTSFLKIQHHVDNIWIELILANKANSFVNIVLLINVAYNTKQQQNNNSEYRFINIGAVVEKKTVKAVSYLYLKHLSYTRNTFNLIKP